MLNFLQSRCGSCLEIELVNKSDVDKSCHLLDVFFWAAPCLMFIWAATCLIASTSGSSCAPSPPHSDDLRVLEQLSESDLAMFKVMLLVGYFMYVWSLQKKKVIVTVHVTLVFLQPWNFPDFGPFQRFSSFRPHCLTLTSLLFSLLSSICSLLGHVWEMWECLILEPGDWSHYG